MVRKGKEKPATSKNSILNYLTKTPNPTASSVSSSSNPTPSTKSANSNASSEALPAGHRISSMSTSNNNNRNNSRTTPKERPVSSDGRSSDESSKSKLLKIEFPQIPPGAESKGFVESALVTTVTSSKRKRMHRVPPIIESSDEEETNTRSKFMCKTSDNECVPQDSEEATMESEEENSDVSSAEVEYVIDEEFSESEEEVEKAQGDKWITAIANKHYKLASTGLYKCLGLGCDKTGARDTIKTHARTCFPELRQAHNEQSKRYNKSNRKLRNKYEKEYHRNKKAIESTLKENGEEESFECDYKGCDLSFCTEYAFLYHIKSHLGQIKTRVVPFMESLNKIDQKEFDSQNAVIGESQGSLTSSEAKFNLILDNLRKPYFVVYFVVVVRKFDLKIGLMNHLRAHKNDPSFIIKFYIGKHTSHDTRTDHNIGHDHFTRTHSSLYDHCKSGEFVAFEVCRRKCDTAEEMEKEECYWQVVGLWNKRCHPHPELMQWEIINKRTELANAHKHLDSKERRAAKKLGERYHPLICCEEGCKVKHNTENFPFYGKLHLVKDNIKHLEFK